MMAVTVYGGRERDRQQYQNIHIIRSLLLLAIVVVVVVVVVHNFVGSPGLLVISLTLVL